MIVDGKEYTEIDIAAGTNLDEAIVELIGCRDDGKLAYINFNGTILYSDTVTPDGAYKEVTGMTRAEFFTRQDEERKKYEREEAEHKKKIPELTEEWKEKGHKILDEKYWELWDEVVPIRLGDLYRGMELGCTLDIVEKLNAGCDFAEAREIFEKQGHSGMSASLMFSMLINFCERGADFVRALRNEL